MAVGWADCQAGGWAAEWQACPVDFPQERARPNKPVGGWAMGVGAACLNSKNAQAL